MTVPKILKIATKKNTENTCFVPGCRVFVVTLVLLTDIRCQTLIFYPLYFQFV